MRIGYFLNLDEYYTNAGILNKSFEKASFWRSQGYEVELIILYYDDAEAEIIKPFGSCKLIKRERQSFSGQFRLLRLLGVIPSCEKILMQMLKAFKPDIVYHRTFDLSSFIKRITRVYPTVFEINGNEIGNLTSRKDKFPQSSITAFRIFFIKNFTRRFLQAHSGLVFVTNELLHLYAKQFKYNDLHRRAVVIPNSINFKKHPVRKQVDAAPAEKVKLVFLGKPNLPWHGIETLMKLAEKTVESLEFHLIGVEPDKEYQPANVFTYGYLPQNEYRKIISECHIGIGTLAIGVAGIVEASPLKVREYAAAGLPIIIGYLDTAFVNKVMPSWVLQLPVSEELILNEVDAILNFCRKFKNYIVSLEEASRFFSLNEIELERLSFFEEIHQQAIQS